MKRFPFLILTVSICFFQVGVAQNVLISDVANPNEPSIIMDPNRPNILVAGANLNNYYYSSDTGRTWIAKKLTSSLGVWGDPVVDVDGEGNFYFFHLSYPPNGNWIDRIICQKSTDQGLTWTDGRFTGLNGTKAQDKEWSIIDHSNDYIYLTWTQFDDYGSHLPQDSSIILFSKSADGAETWSEPKRINKVAGNCMDEDDTVEGAVPALGPNGELYVAWTGPEGIVFNRSLDQGETWLNEEIKVTDVPGGWDFAIPGIYRANGLPVTKCDVSGGPNHGTIYINWTDQRNGTDDTDVWLIKSIDGGNSWSDIIRVNDDESGSQQFFTWMDIDQSNGNLYFVFYDRRNHSNLQTDVFLAYSMNGGDNFVNRRISESPFTPVPNVFFGDYTNITAHNDIVRPIWTRLHQAELSIWTDITPLDVITSSQEPKTLSILREVKQYPNPATQLSYVSFKLKNSHLVNLRLLDQKGNQVYTVLENENMGYGQYIIPIDIEDIGLSKGIYYPQLIIDGEKNSLKMIIAE